MNITKRGRHDRPGARPGPVLVIELLVLVMLGAAACTQRSVEEPEGPRTQVTSPNLEGVGAPSAEQAAVPTPSSRGEYLVNIRTGEVTRLRVGGHAWPDVSADGRLIAWAGGFVSEIDGSHLHRVGATGTSPDWGPVGAMGTRPDWSPNGTRLAVDTSTLGVDGSIFVIDVGTGETRRVSTASNAPYAADWSPDGTRILYLSPWGSEDPEIRVVELATGVDTRLRGRGGEQIGVPGENQATWSPDGRRIVYECDDEICTMRSDGSNRHTVYCCPSETRGGQAPQWPPAGTMIAYWSEEDVDEVYVLDLASGAERLIMDSALEPGVGR